MAACTTGFTYGGYCFLSCLNMPISNTPMATSMGTFSSMGIAPSPRYTVMVLTAANARTLFIAV